MRNVLLIMAIWKRPRLTTFILQQIRKLQEEAEGVGLRLYPYIVGSEGEKSSELVRSIGLKNVVYVEQENEPLWAKWQAGAAKAKELKRFHNANWAIVLGSDNLVNLAYLIQADAQMRMGCDFLQPDGCAMMDLINNRASFLRGFQGGAGRVISRRLLDRVDWNVWVPNPEFSIDHHQYRQMTEHIEGRVRRHVMLPVRPSVPWQVIDIKSGFNVWPWSDFMPGKNPACIELTPMELYLQDYFPEVEAFRQEFVQHMIDALQDG